MRAEAKHWYCEGVQDGNLGTSNGSEVMLFARFSFKLRAMAAGLVEALGKFHQELMGLLPQEKGAEKERKACTWTYVCSRVVELMQKYPTGITEAIVLSELLTGLNRSQAKQRTGEVMNLRSNRFEQLEEGRKTSIFEILDTKQVNISAFLDCYLMEINGETSNTRIVKLKDQMNHNWCDKEKNIPIVEMYLHQKLCCIEDTLKKYPLRMTNLRLHKVTKHKSHRLLPTEYVAPILDANRDKKFLTEKFGDFNGIKDDEPFPHYINNILVTVKDIGPLETIHNIYGDSTRCTKVRISDVKQNECLLVLWDDSIAFVNLFQVGDMLGIEEPFFVKEDDVFHLEYGPATLIYVIPAMIPTEMISSQIEHTNLSQIKKTLDGKLDFATYPFRVVSKDIKKNSTNISFLGNAKKLYPKNFVEMNGAMGESFELEIVDEFGAVRILVQDVASIYHEQIYPGQMLLLKNMQVDSSGNCILNTVDGGTVTNISALKGYISSPCMYTLRDISHLENNGNVVILGSIKLLKPRLKKFTKQVHSMCLNDVGLDCSGKMKCSFCKCDVDQEEGHDRRPHADKISHCWKWKFDIIICLSTKSVDTLEYHSTEDVCNDLLQMSSESFACLEELQQNEIAGLQLGKLCVFSVSIADGMHRVDSFEVATDNFLKNFEVC